MTSNSWENRISASIRISSQTINERIKIRTLESMQDLKNHLLYSLSEKTTEGYSPRKQGWQRGSKRKGASMRAGKRMPWEGLQEVCRAAAASGRHGGSESQRTLGKQGKLFKKGNLITGALAD